VVNGRRYLQYDVFTDKPLAGNQLAVFTETAGLGAEEMQAMTRETKFSECTFVQPPEAAGTDVRLRIFGPANEMQFAGHPVIGSTFALADDGVIPPGRKEFTFGLGVGPTLVELEWDAEGADRRLRFAWMTQQKPTYGPQFPTPSLLAAALGLDPAAIRPNTPPQEVSCGSPFMFVPLVSRAAVDQAVIDPRAAAAAFETTKLTRRGLTRRKDGPAEPDSYQDRRDERRDQPRSRGRDERVGRRRNASVVLARAAESTENINGSVKYFWAFCGPGAFDRITQCWLPSPSPKRPRPE
jgi:trans-2,3-dihydro-3-hydroxyanthranilate isomerase